MLLVTSETQQPRWRSSITGKLPARFVHRTYQSACDRTDLTDRGSPNDSWWPTCHDRSRVGGRL